MRPPHDPLDEHSAGRLLQGTVHPDDAPPGYGPVVRLLNSAARLSPAPVDGDEATTTVSAMVEVVRGAPPAPAPQASPRRPMLGKLLAGKALAAVAVIGLTATGAAAATGSLPDPVQGIVSDAVSHVGVDIPHPNHGKSAGHRKDGEHRNNGHKGQNGQDDDPGQSTGDAPGDPGKGMSQFVEENKGGEGPLGQVVCVEASDGRCRSGEDHPGKGGGADDATPSSGAPAESKGKGHKAGGDDETTPPDGADDSDDDADGDGSTPPGSGSPETGVTKSGQDVPAGKGKPAEG